PVRAARRMVRRRPRRAVDPPPPRQSGRPRARHGVGCGEARAGACRRCAEGRRAPAQANRLFGAGAERGRNRRQLVLRSGRRFDRKTIVNARIDAATADDLPLVLALLEQNPLPVDGLRDHLATTLVARRDGRVVGSAALETYADGVLLRSVAVAPDQQHQGLGDDLTRAALRLARTLRAPAVY